MSGVLLIEASTVTPQQGSKGIWRAKLIAADVQGSTGFYPAAVLERDGASAFPAGTHIYYDHPSESEQWERPERSVRDLVGIMLEAATYEAAAPEGAGLYAQVQFFPDAKEQIAAMAQHTGMSIRAAGTLEETDTGTVITSILRGVSVDIVTHAGAGGRLVEMTEAAKNTPVHVPVTMTSGLTESDRAAIASTNTAVTELTTKFSTFLDKIEESRAAKEKAAADAATLTVGQITAKLTESKLPAASQTRLAEAYVSGQDFDAAIKGEQDYIKAITESVRPTRSSDGGQQAGTVETDDTKPVDAKESAGADMFDALFGV